MPAKISNPIDQLDGKVNKYRVLEQSNLSSPHHQVRYSLIQFILAHAHISSFQSLDGCRMGFRNRIARIRKRIQRPFSEHRMSLGRWTREKGKEAEQEGDQHGLKDDDQFDECRLGENKENLNDGERQVTSLFEMRLVLEPSLCKVVLTRLRNKKRPPPLTIVDHKEPGEESSFEQVDHFHLDRQLLHGLGDLRLASLPSPPVVVHEKGFLSMALSHGVTVDLTPRQALRVSNPVQASSIAISSCGRQLAFLHPTGWHFPKARCHFFLTQMFRENAAVWTQVWTQNRTTGMGQRFTSNRNQILFNR